MQKVIFLFAIIGAVLCQVPTNFTTLTSGVAVAGSFAAQSSDGYTPYTYVGNLYMVAVPEGASSVNITFTIPAGQNSDCEFEVLYRNDGFPCEATGVFEDFFCGGASEELAYFYNGESASVILTPSSQRVGNSDPGDSEEYYAFPSGGNYYFSVDRDYSGEEQCNYIIRADVSLVNNGGVICNTTGYVSVDLDDELNNAECLQYSVLSATNVSVVNIMNSTDDHVFKINVPQGAGGYMINFTANTDGVYIYASPFSISTYSAADETYCYNDGPCTAYINFPLPDAGNFYIFISLNNNDAIPNNPLEYYSGTLTVTPIACAAGMAGPTCSGLVVPLNVTALTSGSLTQSFNLIPFNGYAYTYFDYTQALVGYDVNIYAYYTAPTTNAADTEISVYVRHNGVPQDDYVENGDLSDISYNTLSTYPIVLSTNDFLGQNGRYYISIFCGADGDVTYTSCNVTLFLNISSVVPGFIVSGAGTGTGSLSTTAGVQSSTGKAAVSTGVQATTAKPINTSGVQATTSKAVNTSGKQATTARLSTTSRVTGSVTTGAKVNSSAFVAPIFAMIVAIALLI